MHGFLTRTLILLLPGVLAPSCWGQPGPQVSNVLLIVSDDLRANVLGCYGNKICQTPNLDRLADRGLLFEHAYCQGTVCAPSRQSFMHSRYRGAEGPNLGEFFRHRGWYSARVGKIFHMRVPGDIIAGTNGKDVASAWTERFNAPGQEAHTPGQYACLNQNVFTRSQENRQSTRMPHRSFVSVVCDSDGSDQPDYKAANKAIELLQAHRNSPFFLAVGFVRPHYPMVAPREYFDDYPYHKMVLPPTIPHDLVDIPKAGLAGTRNQTNDIGRYPDNQKRMWAAYFASVAFMDAQVGRILRSLEQLGLQDSTAVIFTSDHGYHLGDHGFWQKSNLHQEVIRVPLIVAAPRIDPGRSSALVELVDLYPTACELTGGAVPESVQGKSLVPLLTGRQDKVRDAALSLHRGGFSLRTADWHYLRYQTGEEELYDMRVDPHEFDNVAGREESGHVLQAMRRTLRAKRQALGLE